MADIEERVFEILAKETRRDRAALTRETKTEDLGITSLEMVEVLMQIEDELGVEIELDAGKAARELATLGDIADAVRRLAGGRGTAEA